MKLIMKYKKYNKISIPAEFPPSSNFIYIYFFYKHENSYI
jgi:hypothetical protein